MDNGDMFVYIGDKLKICVMRGNWRSFIIFYENEGIWTVWVVMEMEMK
jgi:hypothetical protein